MPSLDHQQLDLIAAVALAQPAVTATDMFMGDMHFFTPRH